MGFFKALFFSVSTFIVAALVSGGVLMIFAHDLFTSFGFGNFVSLAIGIYLANTFWGIREDFLEELAKSYRRFTF